jgi:hypothetical protein
MLGGAIRRSAHPRGRDRCRVHSLPASYGNPFQYCLRSSPLIESDGTSFSDPPMRRQWQEGWRPILLLRPLPKSILDESAGGGAACANPHRRNHDCGARQQKGGQRAGWTHQWRAGDPARLDFDSHGCRLIGSMTADGRFSNMPFSRLVFAVKRVPKLIFDSVDIWFDWDVNLPSLLDANRFDAFV